MISFLKEVGRGKRGARDLTYEEATQCAKWILNGTATPVQVGAFLIAERIKMESSDEIHAFVDVLRQQSRLYPAPLGIDCSGPYDGRKRTFMATFPVAFVLASCDVPTTLHSSSSLPPKWGVTLSDLINLIGVDTNEAHTTQTLIHAAEQTGVLYIHTEKWCPPLEKLRKHREELGMRTVFNTAEKLLLLSDAPCLAIGVYHGTVFDKMATLLQKLEIDRAIIVQGMEGSEDLPIDKRTRSIVVRGGQSNLFIVDPEVYELQTAMPDIKWTAKAQYNAAISALRGEADIGIHNCVVLNAAVRLWIYGQVLSIEDGIQAAQTAIHEGKAWQRFEQWRQIIGAHSYA